jgi:hemolysin D
MTPASTSKVVAFPARPERRLREELAFLPAALEIVETPPSPFGRLIGLTVIVAFCLALGWATFGEVDIVASAPGRIIPNGRTKLIQPFETGVVRAIRVHDGQRVQTGEVLIELDPTINQAELGHLRGDLIAAQLDVARLHAALAEGDDPAADFAPPAGASPAQVATQGRFLIDQVREQHAKLAALDRQRVQKEAERATIAKTIEKLQATLPLLQQRADIRKTLYDHETGSKWNYLEILQALTDGQKEIEVQRSKYQESDAALAAIVQTRAQIAAEYRRTWSAELVEAERKASGLTDDVVKATQRTRLQALAAPVAGTVQQLAVHTVGGVVTPAQSLMVIVPADSRLEIEAMVPNRDIGFVRAGQPAEIKVDTFNFTKYGLLHGEVLGVSQDAITRDKPQDRSRDRSLGAASDTSEPLGQEMTYAARISLDRTQMQVEDRLVALTPGMAVTVEIRTGTRRIISYLLSPLMRFTQESLHER